MTDRILDSAWWIAVMAMICVCGGIALFVGYTSLFDLMACRWNSGAVHFGVGALTASAALLLCRHRNDLLV